MKIVRDRKVVGAVAKKESERMSETAHGKSAFAGFVL